MTHALNRLRGGLVVLGVLGVFGLCGIFGGAGGGVGTAFGQPGADAQPEPAFDTRFVYVSSSHGDDGNDGTTSVSAVRTLAAGASLLRPGSSDWLLLRRGDVWNEGLSGLLPDGASADAPIWVVPYGDGANPVIAPSARDGGGPDAENVRVDDGVEIADVPEPPTGASAIPWEDLTPSPDSRVIYVSSSEGSDGNDGFSPATPVRTLAKGAGMLRDGWPDHLLLKRGDTWDESFGRSLEKSGRSEAERLVVSAYGEGPRPRILSPVGQTGIRIYTPTEHIVIADLDLEPLARPNDECITGIRVLGEVDDLVLENLRVSGFKDNIAIQGSANYYIDDVVIRGCLLLDSWCTSGHAQGLYASGVDGLLIEHTLFDHNGHNAAAGADPTIFNHNVYIQSSCKNVAFTNNISARASSHGIQLRPGGVITGNVFIENPLSVLVGGGDPSTDTENGVSGTVAENVVVGGKDLSPSYPRGVGIDVGNIGAGGAVVRSNIVAFKKVGNDGHAIRVTAKGSDAPAGANNVVIEENIIYDWGGGIEFSDGPQRSHIVRGNTHYEFSRATNFVKAEGDSVFQVTFDENHYFHENDAAMSFVRDRDSIDFEGWKFNFEFTASNEPFAASEASTSLADLSASLGLGGGVEGLLAGLRSQSRRSYDERLSPAEIYAYFAAGLSSDALALPYPE